MLANIKDEDIEKYFIDYLVQNDKTHPEVDKIINQYFELYQLTLDFEHLFKTQVLFYTSTGDFFWCLACIVGVYQICYI